MTNLKNILPARAGDRGFTLIEVLMVMVIAVILLGVGVPSFKNAMSKYRLDGFSRSLADDLLLAREESNNGVSAVTICASSTGTTCDTTDWTRGHIVFRDPNKNGAVDTGETLVRVDTPPADKLTGLAITATQVSDNASFTRGWLIFDESKLDVKSAIRFSVCKDKQTPRLITVGRNGNFTTVTGTLACS